MDGKRERRIKGENILRHLFAMRIEVGEPGKKVELLLPRKVIRTVDAGETSNRGRW
jgi:hypothetical protein